MYNIIGSSSKGNCVIYHNDVMVDLGVSFKDAEIYFKDIKIILLTHKHGDHFNKATITRVGREYPNITLVVPDHMIEDIKPLKYKGIIKVIKPNIKYKFGKYIIEAFELFHDVPNVGYKVQYIAHKLIHATDTGSILHVKAKDYDLYAIEHNYDESIIDQTIRNKINDGVFAHEVRSKEYHLSFQQAEEWINSQRKESSEIIKLHTSSSYEN